MGVLQAHKFKILTGLGVISAAGICISTPFLKSEDQPTEDIGQEPADPAIPQGDQPYQKPEEVSPPSKEPEKSPPIPGAKTEGKSEEGIPFKLTALKGKKTALSNQVSQNITIYNRVLREVNFIAQLDSELQKCKSKNEVDLGITEQEKNSLSTSYQGVKGDVKQYEDLKKEIEGDLKQKESYADKDSEAADRYEAFEKAFSDVSDKYKQIESKNAGEELAKNYKIIYDKLDKANSACSFKDVIKINDLLGQRNDAVS